MDPLTIIQLVMKWGPLVKSIVDEATSNDDIVAKIKQLASPIAGLLEQVGSQMFPKAASTLHIVGGIVAGFDPNVTKWLQSALNVLVSPSPNLVVDGIYGPLTKAAVEQVQAKLGLTVDGLAGQVTQAAIAAALK